ncbi:hypothetical protein [Mycolicibacterium austroafricanum]|nr:hypothetical protein [Mycolicibacterium austroafricanum]QZT62129.1 hypothetical protein JN085_25020 [Mycolicibacterium austroafricanum]
MIFPPDGFWNNTLTEEPTVPSTLASTVVDATEPANDIEPWSAGRPGGDK